MTDCGLRYHRDSETRCRGPCTFPCWRFLLAQACPINHRAHPGAPATTSRANHLAGVGACSPKPSRFAPSAPPARATSVPACHQGTLLRRARSSPGLAALDRIHPPPDSCGPSPSDRQQAAICIPRSNGMKFAPLLTSLPDPHGPSAKGSSLLLLGAIPWVGSIDPAQEQAWRSAVAM